MTFRRYFINCLVATLFVSQVCFSQKTKVGIKAGLAFAKSAITYHSTSPQYTPTQESQVGILFGGFADVLVNKNLFFRGGVELVPKGNKTQGSTNRFSYLDIPFNILYKINNETGSVIIGGGPTIGIPWNQNNGGIFNKLKTDIGINGTTGFEFPIGFSVNLNYTYGLLNVSSERQYVDKILNRYLGITLGYTF